MKKARTKFLSLLLVLCMVISMIPVAVFAAEEATKTGTGSLVGGTVYTLNTDGVIDTSKTYLIVNTNSGDGHALTNSNGTATDTEVEIVNNTITVDDDTNIAWTLSGTTSGTVSNNGRYVYPNNASVNLNTSSTNLTINNRQNGAYRLYHTVRSGRNSYTYYLRYNYGWTGGTSSSNVYLYEYTSSSEGEAVTFTVTPGSVTMAPGGEQALTGTVTVGGENVDLSNCAITWASSDTSKATVSNGTVTAVADGTANITATLTAVDGKAVANNGITLTIPVTVQSKQIAKKELTGNNTVTTKVNTEPDFSRIALTVTYDDGTMDVLTVGKGLTVSGYNTAEIGIQEADIFYGNEKVGEVRVIVDGNPYEGKEEATDYPVYPADGAVRVNKKATEVDFQNTGVVQVELDVAGISVKQGVDVVLIVDVSNSMGWSLENAGASSDSDRIADAGQTNKLKIAMDAASDFADILLEGNSGNSMDNTLSFVTFAGYDSTFGKDSSDSSMVDSLMEVFQRETSADDAKVSFEGTTFEVGTSSYHLTITDNEGETLVDGTNRGDTNYDYAFWQATQTVNSIKEYNTANGQGSREVYVIFMTDGAPSHYNHNNKQGTSGRDDRFPDGSNGTYKVANDYDTNQTTWYNYFSTNANTYAKTLYSAVNGNFMAIGFDLAHGGFTVNGTMWQWSEEQLVESLSQVAHDTELIDVYATAEASELQEIYSKLAKEIRYAGTDAKVTDIMDSRFELQMTQSTGTDAAATKGDLGFKPTIELKAYELWTKDETSDNALIGTRKTNEDGSYKVETLETITFSDDGTEAYSNLKSGNIMTTSDGTTTIAAEYFTYTRTSDGTETFKWNIGNITDKEVALSYYAYLTDTLEGNRPEGLYYTNESAVLEYIDINDKYANKVFPMPQVAWGGASTAYEFYLVNEQGQPCDRDGNEIPFANRIVITGPYYEELYLNQSENYYSKEIVAAKVLPAGYTLFDPDSYYTVQTASGNIKGGLNISPVSENAKAQVQTTIMVSATTPSYVQSHVAFGVLYNEIPEINDFDLTPDRVVIDYGKSIQVNIKNGNVDVPAGATTKLLGFSKYYADIDLKTWYTEISYLERYDSTYGDFSIADADECIVQYTPTDTVDKVEMIFCVIEITEGSDTYYMVDWLTVIPATIVYYETDFADGVFTKTTSGEAWGQESDGSDEKDDNSQDDGTIGKNQTYGYDSTYTEDTLLSDGDSWFVHGQGYDTANGNAAKTYTLFNFEGTGFDLISRTGADQGLIKVEVFSDAAMTKSEKTVSVLNKSDSALELYQIPVVSINDLAYGTHYVRVSVDAAYTSSIPALSALNRGDEFYFDAVRVYNPAQGDSVAEAAYIEDGEANNQIDEVRALLLPKQSFDELDESATSEGMIYVDTIYDEAGNEVEGEHNTVEVMTYAKIGPNNEVYLAKNQAIAFMVEVTATPASFDIGAKTITGGTAKLSVTVTKDASLTEKHELEKNVASSTAQYYNMLESANNTSEIFANKTAYVVITNTGDDVLSITDIKAAYGNSTAATALDLDEEASDPVAVRYTANAATFAVARSVLTASADVPEVEIPEETIPEETVPEVTEPEATEPEVTEPEATEPEVTEPEVTEPEATEPEATEPENNHQEEIYNAIKQIITGLSNLLSKWFN